ncbi:hypothetical protein EA438_05735 [Streptococcus dysgalactiae subsp. dysgalactiae]|nr:hypothetical protein [Streptococcus dysgalactiae subsp. dysgalactiae]
MIARIRTRERGKSQFLCELNIMQFTESQVRDRMQERGIRDDAFFVCGFSDWSIDRIMYLSDCFLLKKCINELYDGDDFIVKELLKRGYTINEIITRRFIYRSNDEEEVMLYLLRNVDRQEIISFWKRAITFVNAFKSYSDNKILLETSKGYYVDIANS